MKRVAVAVLTLGLLVGPAPAAEARGYKTFHPLSGVTARQIGPKRITFTNRTGHCVALTVTQRKRYRGYSVRYSATHRIEGSTQTDLLWVRRARVIRVRLYKPGCY